MRVFAKILVLWLLFMTGAMYLNRNNESLRRVSERMNKDLMAPTDDQQIINSLSARIDALQVENANLALELKRLRDRQNGVKIFGEDPDSIHPVCDKQTYKAVWDQYK